MQNLLASGTRVFKIVREHLRHRIGVPTLVGTLVRLRENGFRPSMILDIGAYEGEWSRTAAKIFPDAKISMFEANAERSVDLQAVVREISNPADYVIGLLGASNSDAVTYFVQQTGSSVFKELTSFPYQEIKLAMATLDSLIETPQQPDLLIKLDVQGYELEVLRGAARTIKFAEVIILEASLLPYNKSAPLFDEVVLFMKDNGFVTYDFCGFVRRETDATLFQADVAFVRKSSPLRQHKKFWAHEL